MSGKMGDANGSSASLLKPNFSSAGWPWRGIVSVSFETGNDDQSGVDVKLPVRANWPARPSRNHGELCSRRNPQRRSDHLPLPRLLAQRRRHLQRGQQAGSCRHHRLGLCLSAPHLPFFSLACLVDHGSSITCFAGMAAFQCLSTSVLCHRRSFIRSQGRHLTKRTRCPRLAPFWREPHSPTTLGSHHPHSSRSRWYEGRHLR